MKAKVYDLKGNVVEEIELPPVFDERVREDLIKRAVLSEESKEYQPKGAYRWAGMETSARYVGRKGAYESLKNRGQAMLPREFYGGGVPGRVRRIPYAVGGRRAHPPKPWKKIVEKINKKEWIKAMRSALASVVNAEIVLKRGHKVNPSFIPFIVVDDFESIKKTKEVKAFLEMFFADDLKRAEKGKRVTGVRKRKRGKKYPKSVLIVTLKKLKAGNNIPGVSLKSVEELKVKDLAPGTHAGRLTIFTKSALAKLNELWGG